MEVKILCPCGAKYKFDVEPLHGKLPGPVKCPVCGADGTEAGNRIVAQQSASGAIRIPAVSAPAAASVAPAAAPSSPSGFVKPVVPRSSKELAAPVIAVPSSSGSPAPVPSPVPTPTGRPALSVAGHAAPAAEAPQAPPVPPVPPVPPRSAPQPARSAEPSFSRGIMGVVFASAVALIFWFVFTYFVGTRFKIVVIGLGAFIGWCGAWMAQQKSQRLAIASAVATGLVVLLGLLWTARQEAFEISNATIRVFWEARQDYARGAVNAKTDDELRKFLSENGYAQGVIDWDSGDEDDPVFEVPPEQIDPKILVQFRAKELPELRKIAEGKVSFASFERQARPKLESAINSGWVFERTFRFRTLTLMFLAIGAAWKLCMPS